MKRTIAVLCHENQGDARYTVHDFADVWREDGHRVVFLFGARSFVPADLVLLHVNLSVVPDEYLELASRYPIVVNGKAKDIRKSTYSTLRVTRDDPYAGPVIVKSDLNYAGVPEAVQGVVRYESPAAVRFRSPLDYAVLASKDDVASADWENPEILVERFVPEMDGKDYVTRAMNFLGDRVTCGKLVGPHPIVNGETQTRIERVEPPREMLRLRKKMGFDFGKFDYVMRDGEPILLDANKTVGTSNIPMTPERAKVRRYRAEGLYSYFDRAAR
ncbi:MAG: hypothetical protein ACLQVI_15110 [Polyangiaceae bacterium]